MERSTSRPIHDLKRRFCSRKGAKPQSAAAFRRVCFALLCDERRKRRIVSLETYFAPLRLCVSIFFVLTIHSQTPRLVELHSPDLTNLEASVREQITAAQAALTAVAKDPATTKA